MLTRLYLLSSPYNFIMHATQSPLLSKRRREYINQPYQLSIIQDEIHKFPECMRKSLRLNKHKQKTNYLRKLNQSFGTGGGSVREEADRLNINICRALHKEKEMQMFASLSPPGRRMEEYENTADRMMDMRRRLSPVKFPQQKNHPRTVISEDSVRGKEAVQNQTVFLNIEKLNLIKIYSQIERNIDTSRGNSIETRYLESSTVPHSPQEEREGEGEKDLREVVVSLRKTLREGRSMKWPSSNFKVRTKPFLPPFQRYFYRDFLWKVAFSNGILLQPIPEDAKFKVFVGRGNNSQLVRSLIKRRPWWSFTERWQDANLVWTQLKINNYFALQSNAQSPHFTQLKQPLPKEVALRNQLNHKIMNESDVLLWDSYWSKFRKVEEKITEDLSKRKYYIKKDHLINTLPASTTANKTIRMQNHLPQNYIIGNKKALLYTMSKHYQSIGKKVFNYLPLSFHVKKGLNDEEYNAFLKRYYERKKEAKNNGYNNVWIVKPGELTNRGNGIIVCFSLQEIKSILKRGGVHEDGTPKTFILQEYIEKPFLYQRRKFDIRHYMLATVVNGRFKGYWFKRGYIRTSSNQYTLSHSQASVHLTNDAVQKFLPDYGRYQKGNKLSYEEFQAYLEKQYAGRYNFFEEVYPQMKAMATDALRASGWGMDPSRKQHNFQLFGMDFMIDGQFKPWLIEINTNPCLQLSCPLLADIIPALIENTLKLCMDSVVCPPCDFVEKRPRFQDNALVKNEFELVCECMAGEGDKQGQKGEGTYPRVQLDRKEYDREEDEVFEDDGQSFDD